MDLDNNRDHHSDSTDPFEPLTPDVVVEREEEQKPRPHRRMPLWLAATIAFVIVALGTAFAIRYLIPYSQEAQVTGYVTNIEKRGLIFRTYEGEMITEYNLTDTSRTYQRDFCFTVPNADMAKSLQRLQGTGRPVRITFKRYHATVPWRGSAREVVTDIEPLTPVATHPVTPKTGETEGTDINTHPYKK